MSPATGPGTTDDAKWAANPGSRAALDAGCICAVLDNNHGQFPVTPPDGWWITEGCPVHFPAPEEQSATDSSGHALTP